jgi:hypothetical protein
MLSQYIRKYLWLGILLAIVVLTKVGCDLFPESSFQLATDSRLPKWFTSSPELKRTDVSLTMNYYSMPWGPDARVILRDKNGHILKKDNGKERCSAFFELETPPQGFPSGYPAYQAITVNGVTEIIEHRKMEPIFYVTDNPVVWTRYKSLPSCSH